MSDEITELFGPGLAETRVIRNGIDAGAMAVRASATAKRPCAADVPGTTRVREGDPRRDRGAAPHPAHPPRHDTDGRRRRHPSSEWLVEQARKHKVLKATTFVGRSNHEELVQLLHTADAAVLPSHYEPFGIVALEAAATGIPLVTSNVGGLGEAVINGQTGLSYPAPRCRGAWPRRCAPCSTIPQAAQRRAIAARERLTSDFDWHTVAGETAQVYLAAKRGEREPHPRRPIVEHALPDR